ncbi:hypothetical protein DID88_006354 [Monilinia fructigena]|uniref:Uncharacterized protein n=1 Tax=Monilinia fructigena TaxID=38457 RepID=A0A395J2G4_9HELO|nr:hypothetical protein DID88_006354 [Monilinia fructigena]
MPSGSPHEVQSPLKVFKHTRKDHTNFFHVQSPQIMMPDPNAPLNIISKSIKHQNATATSPTTTKEEAMSQSPHSPIRSRSQEPTTHKANDPHINRGILKEYSKCDKVRTGNGHL